MAQMLKWIARLIEKGSSVKYCLEMLRQEQEAIRTEKDIATAERKAARAEKESDKELDNIRLAHEKRVYG